MKRLVIQVSGRQGTAFTVHIRPGTTSRDILAHLKLAGFVLAPAADPAQELMPGADVYRETRDGQKLIALTRLEAADRFLERVAVEQKDAVRASAKR